jgi:hypothetical protein
MMDFGFIQGGGKAAIRDVGFVNYGLKSRALKRGIAALAGSLSFKTQYAQLRFFHLSKGRSLTTNNH